MPAQDKLAYLVRTMASNLHKGKVYAGANKLPSIDRWLTWMNASQEI
jgi:hypothetical protein